MSRPRMVAVGTTVPKELAEKIERARGAAPKRARAAVVRLALTHGLQLVLDADAPAPGGYDLSGVARAS